MAKPLWEKVAKGEQYVFIEASSSAAVLHLGKALEPYPDVKVALITSGSAVFETIETLKKFKPTLIIQPRIDTEPNRRQFRINAARMAKEAGLEVAFTGLAPGASVAAAAARGARRGAVAVAPRGAPATNRDVPLFAVGYLVKAGLERKAALESLTLKPAQAIGLADRLGTIEPKKDANLLIFSGDPLETTSRLVKVMVEGKFVYEN